MIVVDLLKVQLLSENKELQLFESEDWVIALQAASSTFSEQDQQSLFDMLKGSPKYYVVTLINNHYPNKYFIITIIAAIRLQSGSAIDTAIQADYLAVAPGYSYSWKQDLPNIYKCF